MKIRWSSATTPLELMRFYRSILPKIGYIAALSGYGIGVHGSMRRDLDLIAVPWRKRAVQPSTLADRISIGIVGARQNIRQKWIRKPHGRRATVIMVGRRAYIDLSVIPFLVKKSGRPRINNA